MPALRNEKLFAEMFFLELEVVEFRNILVIKQRRKSMEYYDLIRKRYSVRSYSDRKVESVKLSQILEAARIAPTGCNRQPFKIIVCDMPESLQKVQSAANLYGAPLALIVCAETDKAWVRPYDGKNIAEIDAGIVTTQMMLEAVNQGLGSVWICHFNPETLRSEFKLPANLEPVNILAVGYASGEAPSANRFETQRKKISELVFYNRL